MGKVKKAKLKKNRSAPYSNDTVMEDTPLNKDVVEEATPASTEPETSHALFKRQAAEWKKMKSQVALLKKERSKLRNKVVAEREKKKQISHKIKELIHQMRDRHQQEAKALGIGGYTAMDAEAEQLMED